MARNSFYVNRESLYDELNALSDEALAKRLEENHDFLFGEGRMTEEMIQDCAQMEHLTIEARQIERLGKQIQDQRTAARTALEQGSPQPEPGM